MLGDLTQQSSVIDLDQWCVSLVSEELRFSPLLLFLHELFDFLCGQTVPVHIAEGLACDGGILVLVGNENPQIAMKSLEGAVDVEVNIPFSLFKIQDYRLDTQGAPMSPRN